MKETNYIRYVDKMTGQVLFMVDRSSGLIVYIDSDIDNLQDYLLYDLKQYDFIQRLG